MSNISVVLVWVFTRLYIIIDTVLAYDAFTIPACWDTLDTILLAAAHFSCCSLHYNSTLCTAVASHVPRGLVLELTHTHEHLPSIHSYCGPRACSAEASNPGFGDRHGENAVHLHLLLEVESLVWSPQPLPSSRTCCNVLHPKQYIVRYECTWKSKYQPQSPRP